MRIGIGSETSESVVCLGAKRVSRRGAGQAPRDFGADQRWRGSSVTVRRRGVWPTRRGARAGNGRVEEIDQVANSTWRAGARNRVGRGPHNSCVLIRQVPAQYSEWDRAKLRRGE